MSEAHAEYAPSSMYLTVACPGWREQSKLTPPEPLGEAAREGEAGHEIVALAARCNGWTPSGRIIASNGVEITDEMIDGARLWVEALEGYPAHIETPIAIRRIHMTKCWGTPDARQWSPEARTIRLADYKFGHEFVDEFENWQMLAYVAGFIDEIGIDDRDTDVRIEMTIVQPRYYGVDPIRTWTITLPEFWPYLERMQAAVREAEGPNPRTMSGTHCTHCPARSTCKTLQRTVHHAVDFGGRADPILLTPEQIGPELYLVREFIKRLEARETGLATLAETMIRQGARVPNFELEPTFGRLAWTVPLKVVEMTAQLSGKSALKPPELITPTQAKERKILDARVISEYSDRPKTGFKLVPTSPKTARKFK